MEGLGGGAWIERSVLVFGGSRRLLELTGAYGPAIREHRGSAGHMANVSHAAHLVSC